jgi:hypothetical protein
MEKLGVVDTLKEMLTLFITFASLQLLFNFFAYLCIGLIKEIIFLFVKNKKKMKLYTKLDDIIVVSIGSMPIFSLIICFGILLYAGAYPLTIVPLILIIIQFALIRRSIKNLQHIGSKEDKIFDEKLP